jgi:adenylate cyclase
MATSTEVAVQRENRRLAAIVAADIAGYSRLIGQDEEGTLRALRAHRQDLIDRLIEEHGGRIANTAGDSLLLEFPSAVDAVRCCVAVQDGMAARNQDIEEARRIRFRVGIHIGDVVAEGGDLLGDGVNVAARLEGLSRPGEVTVSDDAYRQVRDRLDLEWRDDGEHDLKNIVHPVRVWRWRGDTPGKAEGTASSQRRALPQQAPSIAVLAFKNLSGDPEQAYFADAVAEDITTGLSRFRDLFVISRESAFHYRNQAKTAKTIAEELGVTYLLEGSVQRAGERLRVNVQLIEAETERHLWAERYDRVITDLFAIQDEIVDAVVSTLGETIWRSAAAELTRKPIENFEAHDYVLRGLDLLHRFDKQANSEARRLLTKAIELDPHNPSAHVCLAWTYVLGYVHRLDGSDASALDRALAETRKAAAVAGNSYDVHRLYSRIALARGDHEQAIAHIERALELNPNDGDLYANYAQLLCVMGRLGEARRRIDEAIRRNPHYPSYYGSILARIHYLEGADDAALTVLNMVDTLTINDHVLFAGSYAQLGRLDEARRHAAEVLAIDPDFRISDYVASVSYRRDVDRDRVTEGLRKAGLPK